MDRAALAGSPAQHQGMVGGPIMQEIPSIGLITKGDHPLVVDLDQNCAPEFCVENVQWDGLVPGVKQRKQCAETSCHSDLERHSTQSGLSPVPRQVIYLLGRHRQQGCQAAGDRGQGPDYEKCHGINTLAR